MYKLASQLAKLLTEITHAAASNLKQQNLNWTEN